MPSDASGHCSPCSSIPGRVDPSRAVARSVNKQLMASGRCSDTSCPGTCLCELEQATGDALSACQSDPNATTPGYCYIDASLGLGDAALLGECPGQRGLRFVGEDTPRNGAQTFIACVGAPFADPQ